MEKSNKKAIILASLTVAAVFIALFSLSGSAAITRSFSDDFSAPFSIDRNLTSAKIEGGKISLPDGVVSARVVSTRVHTTSFEIVKAKIETVDEKPRGSRIIYYLSNDNGRNWLQVTPGFFYDFSIRDGRLKWMAVLTRGEDNRSPSIDKIEITFREDSESLRNANDSRRVSDLATVKAGLEIFFQDFNQYPHVEGNTAEQRWDSLRSLLNRRSAFSDRFYVFTWPEDPLRGDPDTPRSYDYQDFNASRNFVLAARFENPKGFALATDLDGRFSNIDCNDPVYCIGSVGVAPTVPPAVIPTPTPTPTTTTTGRQITTTREVFDPSGIQGMVTDILANIYGPIARPAVIGGTTQVEEERVVTETPQPTPTQTPIPVFGERVFRIERGFLIKLRGDTEVYEVIRGQKHWIPNAAVFEDYGFKVGDIRIVDRAEFNIYPRVKLLRILGDSRVYYLTEQGRVRLIHNAEIFFSYGNRLEDIVDISVTEFNSYPPIRYIFLDTREDTRVWLLDEDFKRPLSVQALQRLRIPWQEIAPVNRTEFDFYRVGDEIK